MSNCNMYMSVAKSQENVRECRSASEMFSQNLVSLLMILYCDTLTELLTLAVSKCHD